MTLQANKHKPERQEHCVRRFKKAQPKPRVRDFYGEVLVADGIEVHRGLKLLPEAQVAIVGEQLFDMVVGLGDGRVAIVEMTGNSMTLMYL